MKILTLILFGLILIQPAHADDEEYQDLVDVFHNEDKGPSHSFERHNKTYHDGGYPWGSHFRQINN